MIIALDCAHERQTRAGVARYSRSLAAALSKRGDLRLLRLGGGSFAPRSWRKKLLTARQDFLWYPFLGRHAASKAGASVYHCPSPRAPITRGQPPTVVTIHDLASFRFPETLTRWTRFYERATLKRVTRSADRIIVPSADTASDVERILAVSASKIRVVPLGVDPIFFAADDTPAPFHFPYVLFVGTPQPRKNLNRIASAIALLGRRGHDLQLVIAGAYGWGDDFRKRGSERVDGGTDRSSSHEPSVHFIGHVSDERLHSLYAHAACVALVSLHEGFGLPALEAMAAGAPVVASHAAALPETTGGAAIMVDPMEIESIADGIIAAIARRDSLIAAGRQRASLCTWGRTAELTVAVYREIAATP
jgi:glycosyltransferase involved in cell wall biosynthesis